MHSCLVGEERFPIEKQESIKTLVAICHTGKLSTLDNQVKVISVQAKVRFLSLEPLIGPLESLPLDGITLGDRWWRIRSASAADAQGMG